MTKQQIFEKIDDFGGLIMYATLCFGIGALTGHILQGLGVIPGGNISMPRAEAIKMFNENNQNNCEANGGNYQPDINACINYYSNYN